MLHIEKGTQVLVYMGKDIMFDEERWLSAVYMGYMDHGHYVKLNRNRGEPFEFKTDEDKIIVL